MPSKSSIAPRKKVGRRDKNQREMAEEEEEVKAILREAFGDSSSDSDGESSRGRRRRVRISDSSDEIARPLSIFGDSHIWEQITEINGLWICRDFLSADQQSSLLSALGKDGYLAEASHNQAMRFGDLPGWALEVSQLIRENICFSSDFCESIRDKCVFPSELLWREPLFNQLIVNIYQPGEGIGAHVDLMRFEDGIAIVSLESACVMRFSSVEAEAEAEASNIPVLLSPGSLVLLWGEARYLWKHEINREPGFQTWEGKQIEQKRRTSVTLRRLCPT